MKLNSDLWTLFVSNKEMKNREINNDFSYYMPTKIIYATDLIKKIDHYIDNRKTLIITSSGFIKRGLIDTVKSLTDNIVYIVSEIKSHPEFDDLEIIYNLIKEIDYDIILAIGGGSVMDAAKFLSV